MPKARRQPAGQRDGPPLRALAHDQCRGGRERVRDRDLRYLELAPEPIALAAPIEERGDSGRADRGSADTRPPRPAEGIGDDERRNHALFQPL